MESRKGSELTGLLARTISVTQLASWCTSLAILLSGLVPATAESSRIGLYSGQWADTRLPHLPYNSVTGRLSFDDSRLHSLIVSRQIGATDLFLPGRRIGFENASIELEGTASVHSGLQDHSEVTLGVMLRSQNMDLGSLGAVNLGWANGVSYALEAPAYEFGRDLVRGENTVQLQYYMGFELEYAHHSWTHLSLFTRLHHRSGIYGVISPSKTGSNIIGLGARLRFASD
ncbi:MAG: hypothetical protein ACPH4G_01940 [Henriciella sp.]